ncbi:uncharacterized protein LOC134258633 [Saccostrea cucullata]|uniref:uncharacterized protein LOC134258633 n=1 Tax=Saccostrea cuccullata TaxID=36930 RepID=UPI002ED311BB
MADQSRIRGYTCKCTIGFDGDNCQVDVCDNHDCQNGTCVADHSKIRGYTCNCTIGFDGDNCQDKKRCDNCIEYVKNNSWILAFKAQSQTGINPVDVYKSVGIRHEVNRSYPLECTALKQIPGCFMPYRTGLIDDWEEINVNRVKFQVIIDDTNTQEVVFDGRTTDNINWFTASRILSSTWQDVTSDGQFNYFTLEGHQENFVNRQFYISREHAGCPNDKGWFASSFFPKIGCGFDNIGGKFPAFVACPKATHCVMESEAVNAQAIAIWIKFDN